MAKDPKSEEPELEEPESKESLPEEVIAIIKSPKEIAQIIIKILIALIIALLLFIGKQVLWPPINKAFFNHIILAANIENFKSSIRVVFVTLETIPKITLLSPRRATHPYLSTSC